MLIKGRGKFVAFIFGECLRIEDEKNDEFWLEIPLSQLRELLDASPDQMSEMQNDTHDPM